MKVRTLCTVLAALVLAVVVAGQDRADEMKLQQAIDLLEAKGDSERAIPLLEEVSRSRDEAMAARALLYLGQAQERRGGEQARQTYERIVRQFASQTQVVEQARLRLAGLSAARTPSAPQLSERLLWTMPPQSVPTGSVSRDGGRLLFVDKDGLQLRDLVAGTSRMLIRDTDQSQVSDAVFSPDGQQIAYSSWNGAEKGYELYTARIAGSAVSERRRVNGVGTIWLWPLDWSQDGTTLAVIDERERGVQEIATIDLATGRRRTLKRAPHISTNAAAFSPEGRYLATNTRAADTGTWDIQLLDLEDGKEVATVADRGEDVLVGWISNDQLLFSGDRSGDISIYSTSPRAASQPQLVKANIGRVWPMSVGGGNRIFVHKNFDQALNSDIRIGEADLTTGRWLRRPADMPRDHSPGAVESPDWSPDGRTLAYLSVRRAGSRNAYSVGLRPSAGGVTQEVSVPFVHAGAVRWFPDNSALLIWGQDHRGERGWWRVDLKSGALKMIEPAGLEGVSPFLRWSNDGKRAYFRRQLGNGAAALVEKDIDSGSERILHQGTRGPAGGQAAVPAAVSPDGRKLYFRRAVDDTSKAPFRQFAFLEREVESGAERELSRGALSNVNLSPDGRYVATGLNDSATRTRRWILIETATGSQRELMRMPLPEGQGATGYGMVNWHPDGQSMLVRNATGQTTELLWVPIDGRKPQVLDSDWRLAASAVVRVHPDGRRVAYEIRPPAEPRNREIWVIENIMSSRK